jgi:hypothetical protein
MARPSPVLPPVTTATRPVKSKSVCGIGIAFCRFPVIPRERKRFRRAMGEICE